MASKVCLGVKECKKKQKKFNLGCDVDREEIFTYPYLTDDDTIAYIEKHGRIMFIIRGPNSTMKATLSEMIINTYPQAVHCSANHYFSKTFNPPNRTKETLKLSHIYCEKKVKTACIKNESPIIVQNTHMRKFELQKYIDMASEYNYTIVMAITLYKFNVSPTALGKINPDGLNISYFQNRLKQWQDVPPLFTAWFLSPNDSKFILNSLQITLQVLLNDGKFCSAFHLDDNDEMWQYFDARTLLYCSSGYSCDRCKMKDYYLSDVVQENYGKCFEITILGYLVTLSAVFGIVQMSQEMMGLVMEEDMHGFSKLKLDSLVLSDSYYKDTIPFNRELTTECIKSISAYVEDLQDEKLYSQTCRLIHLAQKRFESFTIEETEGNFFAVMRSLPEDLQFIDLEGGISVHRLPNDKWILRPTKKVKVKTIFSGLYA